MKRSDLTIRPLEPRDLEALADGLTLECVLEIERGEGRTPLEALQRDVKHSSEVYVALADGEPVAVWGLVEWGLVTGVGSPWAFTTRLVDQHRMAFARGSRLMLRYLQRKAPNGLEVMVDAKFLKACRWVRWLGFTLTGPHPAGPNGAPFYTAKLGGLA